MQIENLSWFPGHMTKTKRMISAEIKNMDAVCEIVDARIPLSSRNPDVDELTAGKPRLIVLNRADQADPVQTRRWTQYFRGQGFAVLEANAKNGVGTEKFSAAVRELLRDKLAAAAAKGQVGKVVRVMVLGVPNVGKSTFINKVAHRKTARAEDRPGVTRSKQWVPVDAALELLDTPASSGRSSMTRRLASALPLQVPSRTTCWTSRSWPAALWTTWPPTTPTRLPSGIK